MKNPNTNLPFQKLRWRLLLCCFLVVLPQIWWGCSGSGGGDEQEQDAVVTREQETFLSSQCGVLKKGESVSSLDEAELVDVQVLSSDAAIITRLEGSNEGEKQLIKFHGISSDGVNSFRVENGIEILNSALANRAFYFPAGDECEVVFDGGGLGVAGQLFTTDGENVNELMLSQAAALPEAQACGGDVLAQCYQAVEVTQRFPTELELAVQDVSFESRCGAVREAALANPATKAEFVTVEALSTDLVIINRMLGVEAGNTQFLKLHGLTSEGVSETRLEQGLYYILQQTAASAYLVTESLGCTTEVRDGQLAIVGQLYALDGTSLNESLLAKGYALAESDTCDGGLLASCYEEIAAETPEEVIEIPEEHDEDEGGNYEQGIIRDFLWKPVSEASGKLVVLVNPRDTRIVVRGAITETLRNQGPSNGRGTTARSGYPGCAFGANIVVEFYDANNQPIPVITGGNTVTIADGCRRVEFRR